MRSEVNAISGRLSLRPPQRDGLTILDRVMEIAPIGPDADAQQALEIIHAEYPHVTDFERDFPSLCFALATGVGKTRLMGAFITYLHTAHGIDNFFVLAPNLTIYNKLISDFTEGSPKYVFKGVSAFATSPPDIVTGDNWESYAGRLFDVLIKCRINIFNISKINTEVRGGKSPRIKRLSEYIGQSYFDWLAGLDDLVLLMDESHRYRASAGVRAINELRPILGLELTATPYLTSGNRTIPFENVIQDYSLRRAMEDGFVKEPAVVTRQNFNPDSLAPAELERIKLEDGIRLHEQTKVELETYARNTGQPIVKPFVLVIARDTTHAAELQALIRGDEFFGGRYAEKVIQVDSSGSGAEKDETVLKLLEVERPDSPTEIVIHVNMLKEGWDVTNLYTIVPLRAATARVLIEQTIGRGLRLPYGKRTGVAAVDRLSIVGHDRFQEIVDEANKPDSPIQLQHIVLTDDQLREKPKAVVVPPTIETRLGIEPAQLTADTEVEAAVKPVFTTPAEVRAATAAYRAIERLQHDPVLVPDASWLDRPEVQQRIVREVEAEYITGQLALIDTDDRPDLTTIVQQTARVVMDGGISIPRISVIPRGELRTWFEPFELDLDSFNFPPVSDELWVQRLRDGIGEVVGVAAGGYREARLEDYVISGLIDFDEISYDDHAELLQRLATEVVNHLRSYLTGDEETRQVLHANQRVIAQSLYSQMAPHFREDASGGFETVVVAGFTPIKTVAFAQHDGEVTSFRVRPEPLSSIRQKLYGGFERCLHPRQKFESNPERLLAIVLDRESQKWFRPPRDQFDIYYRDGLEQPRYQPDFVAELPDRIVILETKQRDQLEDSVVVAKRDAAVTWCQQASDHAASIGGKPWSYALIPHDAVNESHTIGYLLDRYRAEQPLA